MCVPVAVTVGAVKSSGMFPVLIGQISALTAVAGIFTVNLWKGLRRRRFAEEK
ncbi:MAG: hypothetical protein ACTSYM_00850 [Candidatus Baldrarchaeia archaeon]